VGFGDGSRTGIIRGNPVPVLIAGLDRRLRWLEIWENNPKIARRPDGAGQACMTIRVPVRIWTTVASLIRIISLGKLNFNQEKFF